jgi:hypothetical protein
VKGDEPAAVDALGAAAPVILVPTTTAEKVVASVCAAELHTTYCSASAAATAAAHCNDLLGPNHAWLCGGACLVTYQAHRTTCQAGPTYPTPAACSTPVADDCSFYRTCMETAQPCGDAGYALGYGERFCYAFVEKRSSFTGAGQAWLRGIRTCLQTSVAPALDDGLTCDALADVSFAAHAPCYTVPGNSFCDLPFSDVLAVSRIVGSALFSSRGLTQIRQVATQCALEAVGLASFSPDQPHVLDASTAPASRAFFADLARAAEHPATFHAFLEQNASRLATHGTPAQVSNAGVQFIAVQSRQPWLSGVMHWPAHILTPQVMTPPQHAEHASESIAFVFMQSVVHFRTSPLRKHILPQA